MADQAGWTPVATPSGWTPVAEPPKAPTSLFEQFIAEHPKLTEGVKASILSAINMPGVGLPPAVVNDQFTRAKEFVTNPEVLGGIAGTLAPATGGASLLVPAGVGAAASVGRDLLSGDTEGMGGRALLHGGLNAIPGAIGAAAQGAKNLAASPFAAGAAKAASHLMPSPFGPAARMAIDMVAKPGAAPVAEAVAEAAPAIPATADAMGGFLHKLTGTAMVDAATPAQRMLLSQQRLMLTAIAKNKAADAAAGVAAQAAAKSAAERMASLRAAEAVQAAAARSAALRAYLQTGLRVALGGASVASQ